MTVTRASGRTIDRPPMDGECSDLGRLAEWGERGGLLLLSDSTNVERPGTTPSERTVTRPLENLIAHASGKVLVATFASHIHRIRQVVDLSRAQGRVVGVVGKRLVENIEVARDTGHITRPPDVFIDVATLAARDPRTVTLLTTGSQGEPLSALSRIAIGGHPQVKLAPGDT